MSGIATAVVGGAVIGGVASNMAASKGAKATTDAANNANAIQWGMYQSQRQDQLPYRYAGTNALNQLAMRLGIGSYNPNSLATANLIDLSSGVPTANQDLYNTNAAYRQAWDQLATQHYQQYGKAYNGDSSVEMINQALRSALAPQIQAEQEQQTAQDAANQSNPLYGSLLRNFTADDFKADPGYDFRIQQGQKQIEGSAAARGGLLSGAAAKALTKYNQDFASNEYSNAYNRFNNDQNTLFNRLAGISGVGQQATNQVQAAGSNVANSIGGNTLYSGTQRASGYANAANSFGSGLGSATNALVNYARPTYGGFNNPYGNYSATSYPVTDYYSGINGTPLA